MSGASRSTRYAVMGFVLMTAVVIGGMSWATVSQLKLAKVRLEIAMNEQMGSRLIDARSRLDRLIAPMIFRESGRQVNNLDRKTVLPCFGEASLVRLVGALAQPKPAQKRALSIQGVWAV